MNMRLCTISVILSIIALLIGCTPTTQQVSKEPLAEQPVVQPSKEIETKPLELPPPEPVERELVLMAVGDIMVHQEQLDAAWDASSQAYNFDPFFAKVKHIFSQADLVIGNLETTLAGSEQRFTGYPMFNTPESLAQTLKQVGFNVLTTANNHSLDRREIGVLRTIEHLDEQALLHTGTFRSAEERDLPLILEKNGIRLGLVSYTYGTNGIPLPQGKPYLVNLLDTELIKKDIARAHELGADLVAVALHFGEEYQRLPNQVQKKWVDYCFEQGADLIIGHHPHVLQPYEWRTLENQDGSSKRGLVIYSLGNFISAQRGDYKDVGAILNVTLYKRDDEPATIKSAELIPTYVHFYRTNGKRNYVIYPLQETLEALAENQDPTISKDVFRKMDTLFKETTLHLARFEAKTEPEE